MYSNMETNDRIIKDWHVIVLLLAMMGLLLYIAFDVKAHYEAFDNDPLLFGAESYEINQCSCFTSSGASFLFNRTTIWQERKARNNIFEPVNFSLLGELVNATADN